MTQRSSNRYLRWFLLSQVLWAVPLAQPALAQVQLPPNFISPDVPHDVPAGKTASIQDIAIFAWREFVALNWPSVDPAATGKRGTPDTNADFFIKKGADGSFPLLVWHTYQHKNELFPADGKTNPSFDSRAPVYKYIWAMPSDGFGGKFGAVHGTDVGTAFHNTRGAMYGETPAAMKIAGQHAGAWVAFARSGNPNHDGIPHWDPYAPEGRATLVFADDTRAENDHRGDFRKLWDDIAPPAGPRG